MCGSTRAARYGKAASRLLVLLVLIALGVAALPTIVAKTGLRNRALALAMPRKAGSISCRQASLGWFSPPALRELQIRDPQGETILTVAAITLNRSPWDLLRNTKDLGTIEVASPLVSVRIRPDGSNVEDFLAALGDPDTERADEPFSLPGVPTSTSFRFRVADGVVVSEDVASGRAWRTEGINVDLQSPGTETAIVHLSVAGRVVPGSSSGIDAQPDGAAVAGTFALQLAPTQAGQQRLDVDARGVPLAALAPWLRRYLEAPVLGGTLTTQGSAVWTPAADATSAGLLPASFHSVGQLSLDQFDFAVAQLEGDRIQMERVEAPWDVVSQGQTLLINHAAVNSPLGQLAARGAVDVLSVSRDIDPAALERHDLEIRGTLDLARLAAMLPHAMRIREGTTITGGEVGLAVRSRPIAGGSRLAGSVEATRLTAVQSQRALRWEAPIRAMFDASVQQDRWRMDSLECRSDFCEVTASGDLRQLEANARFDLDKLAEQLGQFLDLSAWQPSGSGTAHLAFSATPDHRFVADGEFRLQEFVLARGARNVWSEPQLSIVARSAGMVTPATGRPRQVDSAVLQLRAEGDSLDASLTQAVDLTQPAAKWPLGVRATGDLGRWINRLRPILAIDRWQLAGEVDVQANLRVGPELLEVADSQIRLLKVRGTGPRWRIDEPRIEVSGDAFWHRAAGHIQSQGAQFVSSSASMAARNLRIVIDPNQTSSATGQLAVRADLGRIAAMRTAADGGPTWRTTGMLAGNLEFTNRGEQLITILNLDGTNLSLEEPTQGPAGVAYAAVWAEPKLTARGVISYDARQDRLVLEELGVTSQTLAMATGGAVDRLSSERQLNLEGSVDYDLAQIGQLLKPYTGESIVLAGRERARFQLAGAVPVVNSSAQATTRLTASNSQSHAHWSHTLRGKLEAPWQGAGVFGLSIGAGKVVAHLGDGGVRFEPMSFAVGKGRLDLSPYLRLDPAPQELTFARGQILTDVYISREVSEAMLKYIAPVLADATRSSGTFSMRLDEGRVPLADPKAADVTGALRLQQVEVLPGPSTEQWVSLAQRVENLIKNGDPQALVGQPPKAILRIPDRTVAYRVADGRVYHEGMEFYVGEVVVTSRGSVGFDQTLQMTVTVPILDKWVENRPALSGFRGKSVDIPVGGTLSRPRVDSGALTAISGQLLRDAAQGAIGGEINKALNKLLGR